MKSNNPLKNEAESNKIPKPPVASTSEPPRESVSTRGTISWAPSTQQQPRESVAVSQNAQPPPRPSTYASDTIYIIDKSGKKRKIQRAQSLAPVILGESEKPQDGGSSSQSNPKNEGLQSLKETAQHIDDNSSDLAGVSKSSDSHTTTGGNISQVSHGPSTLPSSTSSSASGLTHSSGTSRSRVFKPPSKGTNTKAKKDRKRMKKELGTYMQFFNIKGLKVPESYDSSSSDASSPETSHPDRDWLMESDSEEENEESDSEGLGKNDENAKGKSKFHPFLEKNSPSKRLINFLTPYFITDWILGRLPFTFAIDRKTGLPICNLNRWTRRFWIYTFTSFVMLLAFAAMTYSFFDLCHVKIDNNTKDSFLILEKLLVIDKCKLPVAIFILSLLLTLIGSWTIIYQGEEVAAYITNWFESINWLGYDTDTKFLLWLGWMHPIMTVINVAVLSSLYFNKIFNFHESTDAITVLLFRKFIKRVYFTHRISFRLLSTFVLIFQLYVFFSTRSFVFLITLFCRSIIHLAREWNIRIAFKLRKMTFLSIQQLSKERIERLKSRLGYKRLLKEHTTIVGLLRGISGVFSTILVFYISLQSLEMLCALAASGVDLFYDLKPAVNETFVNGTDIKYAKSRQESLFENSYFVITTFLPFCIFAWTASGAGEVVMAGFETVRRHGLILAKGPTERKFVLSLKMSFNAASPHIIQPGGWFYIDRGLIMTVFIAVLTLTVTIVQTKIVRSVDVPIFFKCGTEDSPALCTKSDNRNNPPMKQIPDNPLQHLNIPSGEVFREPSKKDFKKMIEESANNIKDLVTLPEWNGTGFLIHFNLNQSEMERRCLHYCKGTFVTRVVAFNSEGVRYPFPDDPKECILKPYEGLSKSTVYNCLKIPATEKDNCSVINLSRDFQSNASPVKINQTIRDAAGNKYEIECLEQIRELNPLEVCNSPFTTLGAKCVENWTGRKGFGPNSFKGGSGNKAALCDATKCSVDPTEADSYEINHGVVSSFDLEIDGKTYRIWKMLGLSIPPAANLMSIAEYIIPLPKNSLDKLYRSYAYIHPHLMRNNMSYGYSDCFGKRLVKFDECGNLGFGLVVDNGGVKTFVTPKEKLFTSTGGNTYSCWESRIPGYVCGVPIDLVDYTCKLWKEYLNIIP